MIKLLEVFERTGKRYPIVLFTKVFMIRSDDANIFRYKFSA